MASRLHPELQAGLRIEYRDRGYRCGRIKARRGNTLTIIDALKKKKRIQVEQVLAYWPARVRANPKNRILLSPGD